MTTIGLLLFLCLYFSAFFSGAEMAYISANKLKIRELAQAGDRLAQKALDLQQNPQQFLTAILIGNNVVHVAATSLLAYGLQRYYNIHNELIVTALLSPVMLIFGEMLPKDYCRIRSQSVLLKYADSLALFMKLIYWPCRLIMMTVDAVMIPFTGKVRKSIFVSEEEFRSLIEESTRSGVLAAHEKQIIDTILDFERIHLDSIMIPLEKVAKIDIHGTVGEVKAMAAKTKARMVLVYEDDPSIVVGMIYVFDLLFEEKDNQGLKNFLRSPIFLSSTASIETAFLTLQQKRQSYVVVTRAAGDVAGVVAIENLLVV